MTGWETANRLTQIAIRALQQALALEHEIATELLRLVVDIIGAEEANRVLQTLIAKRATTIPPPRDEGASPTKEPP